MAKYETMLVTTATLDEEATAALVGKFKSLIEANVALMGRLVADPELRHTPNGVATCTFRIAVDRSFVRAGEERKADFIDIVVWRQTAEFVCKYFHKGNLIAVDGSIQTRTYEDKTGNKRYAFEVVANNVHFTGEKSGSTGGQGLSLIHI